MKNILSNFARSKSLSVALLVVMALPALGHADTFRGKFKLNAETHWGTAILAPGEYDFSLDTTSVPTRIVLRTKDTGNISAILISTWSSEISPTKVNNLQLESHDDGVFVNAMYLKDITTELHFMVPKAKTTPVESNTMKQPATMTAAAR